jgi:hypothetical protein
MKKTASTSSSAPAAPAVARAAGGLPKVTKAVPVVPKKAAPPPAAAKVLPPRPDPVGASVKLGSKIFDVNSEEIETWNSGVTAADCSALAARMKTGEISRVKALRLVRFISVLFLLCFIF